MFDNKLEGGHLEASFAFILSTILHNRIWHRFSMAEPAVVFTGVWKYTFPPRILGVETAALLPHLLKEIRLRNGGTVHNTGFTGVAGVSGIT